MVKGMSRMFRKRLLSVLTVAILVPACRVAFAAAAAPEGTIEEVQLQDTIRRLPSQADMNPTIEQRRAEGAKKVLAERAEGKAAAALQRSMEEGYAAEENSADSGNTLVWGFVGLVIAIAAFIGIVQYRRATAFKTVMKKEDMPARMRLEQQKRLQTRKMKTVE